jgi:hypothetical protein
MSRNAVKIDARGHGSGFTIKKTRAVTSALPVFDPGYFRPRSVGPLNPNLLTGGKIPARFQRIV